MNGSYGDSDFSLSLSEWLKEHLIDTIIRHKWPEGKPEKDGQYLIRIVAPSGLVIHRLQRYKDGKWHDFENYITHWWELPEAANER